MRLEVQNLFFQFKYVLSCRRLKDAIRAGNEWYRAFPQDIIDYKIYPKINMPVLGIGGPGYDWLSYTLSKTTTNLVKVKVENSGHFICEEKPEVAVHSIMNFLQ